MALSNQERQAKYQRKIKRGEFVRLQVILPLETSIRLKCLCKAMDCNRTELISRLISEEWHRQDEPVEL